MITFKQLIRKIRIVIAFVLFCYVGFSVFSSREFAKNYYRNDIPPIISMLDLGYSNSFADASDLKRLMLNNKFIGSFYYLSTCTKYDEGTFHLTLEIYDFESNEELHVYFEDIVEQKYTSFKKSQMSCLGYRCKFPTISFKTAVENMFLLDLDLWDSDEAYSIYEINNHNSEYSSVNTIFLLKEYKIIVLQIDKGLCLTEENIKVITKSFDRTNDFIKEMKKTNK